MSHKRSLFRFLHKAAEYDIKQFGRGGVGVALASRYHSGAPWTGIRDLTDDLELSAPQIRRRLERLVARGQVHVKAVAGAYRYALTEDAAEAYATRLKEIAAAEGISF